ncbi:THO complex subunit 2-like isoform X2 [Aristolochia californica]|uniref:THO complex subunit 2-like isoform X2 n=1 Tax=Aristolochia californica TaxID=171875 RepID=UPI0035D5F67E
MSVSLMECKYITEECIREWKNPSSTFKLADPVPTPRFLYELCWILVRGELPFQKCKQILDSVEFSDKHSKEEIASVLADIISQMGQDLTMPGECRARLVKLAKSLVESALVPVRLFQERCEEEFLSESEMVKIKAQDLKAKEVRVNTRLLYQQTKFNLLREESEGYAKLITLLCQSCSETSSQYLSTVFISTIKSLIGHFDLDPNRVFDIVLECFELQPGNRIFLDLIPIFPKSHAAQILGFKFQYYQRMDVNQPLPSGLYQLAALLVKSDFIDLDSIYAHLLPKDDEAFEHYEAFSAKRFDEVNKIGKINLAATGKDLMDEEKQGDVTIDLFAALDMENEAVMERSSELENNQSLGLLYGFLAVDDWYHAHILFERLYPLNPVAHVQICEALFRIIERTISSAYAVFCQMHLQCTGLSSGFGSNGTDLKISSPMGCFIDLPKDLFQMLGAVGPYLHRVAVLLQKVCRVLRGYYLSAKELVSSGSGAIVREGSLGTREPRLVLKEAWMRVEEALGTCLLPSLQLIPANPAVGQEIWELMSLLPYEVRYRLYGEWGKEEERIPMVLAARQTAKLDTRRILKRLAKENLKQLGRMVAKLAHANPMTVLRTIVHQIEAYKDMITPVVDAFKYLTQLEYDVLEYVVIERLAQGGREKLKDDGLNLSDWLQSLACFWGHLCKKYPSMELRGLFQYLVNQLKKGTGIELVLLQELIQQMANVQFTENMTEEQLDAMAGSETLRYQATSFGITRNNKALLKSTNRLRDSLLPKDEPNLAIPLLLLIAQHRSMIVINADAPYIKMVSEQFDRCHGVLLQYVEFLYSAVAPATAYAQLVPSLDELIHTYHLDPEVAFLIYRPVMRLYKCSTGSEVFWPSDVEEANMSSADKESDTSCSFPTVLDLGSTQKPIAWSELLDTVRSILPSKAWNSLSADLYATFWGLTLYDLYVPKQRYESEIAKQNASLKALEELSDNSSSAITKRKKDKERIQELLDRLMLECQKHEENVASVLRRLAREKDNWLSSCPDALKINMEFLQRCIFPRCIFSMPDAVYCAMFVQTLHSLGTPFFNTVNHIEVLISKTLQPMICSCTEFEAGRLGRFLCETLKMAYHWKSDESIYEKECSNMPGFAVYYRFPTGTRVTYSQFIKVHWKWNTRITKLLIQCLESNEYMEIRNALIMLTKISSVFPVTRKSGINLEKRVAKIKGDEREDLKVLATGVAAALASRKSSWVSEEEFCMGQVDLKPGMPNGSTLIVPSGENLGLKSHASQSESASGVPRPKPVDVRLDRSESTALKPDSGQGKTRSGTLINGSDVQSVMLPSKGATDENMTKIYPKTSGEAEAKPQVKRANQAGSLHKQPKQEQSKDDFKSGKSVGRSTGGLSASTSEREILEGMQGGITSASVAPTNGGNISGLMKPLAKITESRVSTERDVFDHSSRPIQSLDDSFAPKVAEKQQKRGSPTLEQDRVSKRRKGEAELKDVEDRERSLDSRLTEKPHSADTEKSGSNDQNLNRPALERSKDKGSERYDREHERSRDRSMERHGRERSMERGQDKGPERNVDKHKEDRSKDDRSTKARYTETLVEKSHFDDRFHGQSLPPPPPLPPNVVPQSVNVSRRDEEADRRVGTNRHMQRLSPRHEEKERRRSEENLMLSQDDSKRRREDDFRERKRDERESLSVKVEERDRDKGSNMKEDLDTGASKRRKLKKEHLPSAEGGGEYSLAPPSTSLAMGILPQPYEGRDRGERKGAIVQRQAYMDEPVPRMHGKEASGKIPRRDTDQMYEREWEDEKRQRAEVKRRHRK